MDFAMIKDQFDSLEVETIRIFRGPSDEDVSHLVPEYLGINFKVKVDPEGDSLAATLLPHADNYSYGYICPYIMNKSEVGDVAPYSYVMGRPMDGIMEERVYRFYHGDEVTTDTIKVCFVSISQL